MVVLQTIVGTVAIVLAVIIPLSVQAGFFSGLFGAAEAKSPVVQTYTSNANAQIVPLLKAVLHTDPSSPRGGGDIVVENGALVPSGDASEKKTESNIRTGNGEINVYVVREGDTLSQIAEMFNVSAKTVLWANNVNDPTKIRPGDALVILPITGVRHVVKSGDTLASIAKKYNGDVGDILSYNQLASAASIQVGDTVVVPDGTMAAPAPIKKGSPVQTTGGTSIASGAGFTHPLPGSVRTQGIHGYNGVDLAAAAGTPILAAAGGTVIISKSSGWNGGYGNYVVIKHPNGTQTLYAHNNSNAVVSGATVQAGQVVGYVGSTGRSTGSHLHFEVRGAKNPF
jgi:LysM repeat protein